MSVYNVIQLILSLRTVAFWHQRFLTSLHSSPSTFNAEKLICRLFYPSRYEIILFFFYRQRCVTRSLTFAKVFRIYIIYNFTLQILVQFDIRKKKDSEKSLFTEWKRGKGNADDRHCQSATSLIQAQEQQPHK